MTTHCVRRNRWTARLAVLLALLAGLLGLAALGGPVSPAFGVDDGGFAQKMFELVNGQRALNHVAPLQWSDSLGSIAQDGRYDGCGFPVSGRATDMGTRNYFSHVILGCGSQGVGNLLSALGIQTAANGENIAWMSGTTDPILAAQRLTDDLMASPGHRANILNPDFTYVGIGSWHTATGESWSGGGSALRNVFVAAQVFAKMSPTASTTTTTAPPTTTTVPKTTTSTAPATTTTVPKTTTSTAPASTTTVPKPTTTAPAPTTTTVPRTTTTTTPPPTTTTTKPPAPLPGAPTAVAVAGGDASVAVSWAPAASGPAVDSYAVFAWDSAGYVSYLTVCATCRSATVTGLTNGRKYYVSVYGHTAGGFGLGTFSGWVTAAAAPGVPAGLVVTPGNASMSASWQGPTAPGTAIDAYYIYVFDANGYTGRYAIVCGTCMSATVGGLENGHSYFAAVVAHNPNALSTPAISGSIVVGTPGPATSVRAVAGNGSAGVSWAPAANSGSGIDAYGLFAFDANGFTGLYALACGSCTTGTVPGLANGHPYVIVLMAHNTFGWSTPIVSGQVVPAVG